MTKYAQDYNIKAVHAGAYGNGWAEDYTAAVKPVAGEKIYLGVLPAGVRIHALTLSFAAAGAGGAITLGLEPLDGDLPAANATAFLPSTDVSAAGRAVAAFDPFTLQRPVALVATVGATAFVNAPKITAVVNGKWVGVK